MKISFNISGGLSDHHLRQIHEAALDIIDKFGIEVHSSVVPDDELLARIAHHRGVRIDGNRVRFSPELVEKHVDDRRKRQAGVPQQDRPVTIVPLKHCFSFLDAADGRIRPFDVENLVQATKLVDVLYEEGVRGVCPGAPRDCQPDLAQIAQYKISCENCRHQAGAVVTSLKAAQYVSLMSNVMGYSAADTGSWNVHMISPMKLEGPEFDIALHFWLKLGNNLRIGVGNMPIMGVTSPINLAASLAQAVAESVAGFVFFKLLTDGGQVDFGFNIYAFEMKYGTFAYGGPEDTLIALARNQLSQWYGNPNNNGDKCLLTMAHATDAQAAAEKAGKTVIALLAGASELRGAGGLSLDQMFSSEQLLMDLEIVGWARRLTRGFEMIDKDAMVRQVRDGMAANGSFMSTDATLDHYRETFWEPSLFEHLMQAQWIDRGRRPLLDRAAEAVRQRVARHEFQLDGERRRELDKIYASAKRELNG